MARLEDGSESDAGEHLGGEFRGRRLVNASRVGIDWHANVHAVAAKRHESSV
jgi:hypothetical protein